MPYMSREEIDSYRFISGREPSDEMLAQLMKEVAYDAKRRQEQATAVYFSEMRREAEIVKAKWAERINRAING